jgi:hypothetical protein
VILVELLKRYDFMGIEGVEAPRDNQYLGLLSVNHEKEILMRHRADV